MAFDSLSERLSKTMKKLTGQGKLTESNMNEMLKEVRQSLLEADVNYQVVKDFIASIKEKAMGQEVLDSLNPGQMVVSIVKDELTDLLGQDEAKINFSKNGITNIMMVGLQGTGKTTASGKIARHIKEDLKKRVLLVANDVVRPAAIEQLQTLGKSIGVDVFTLGPDVSAVETTEKANAYAKEKGYEVVIYDTAGRLHIDQQLMDELSAMKQILNPNEILLTVDAMTGQDIISVAREFNDKLQVTGLVVTKMDGDARGGALLSVRSITTVPVMFVSNGEKMDDLDSFNPERMAGQILGMGDIVGLIDKAKKKVDEEVAEKTAKRMMNGVFTFNDMIAQYEQIANLGSMKGILKMIPGLSGMVKNIDDEKLNGDLKRYKAIIQSMTPYEREHPAVLKASRKKRIAKGSGTTVADVNKLIAQCDQMQAMSKMMSGNGAGLMNALGGMRGMGGSPFGNPGAGMYGGGRHSGSKKAKTSKKKKKKK